MTKHLFRLTYAGHTYVHQWLGGAGVAALRDDGGKHCLFGINFLMILDSMVLSGEQLYIIMVWLETNIFEQNMLLKLLNMI